MRTTKIETYSARKIILAALAHPISSWLDDGRRQVWLDVAANCRRDACGRLSTHDLGAFRQAEAELLAEGLIGERFNGHICTPPYPLHVQRANAARRAEGERMSAILRTVIGEALAQLELAEFHAAETSVLWAGDEPLEITLDESGVDARRLKVVRGKPQLLRRRDGHRLA